MNPDQIADLLEAIASELITHAPRRSINTTDDLAVVLVRVAARVRRSSMGEEYYASE